MLLKVTTVSQPSEGQSNTEFLLHVYLKMTDFQNTSLFGGSIQCSIPSTFTDISRIREVPDHQEVYHEMNSGRMLVFEILEYQKDVSNDHAAQYFFEDLAEADGSSLPSQRKILSSFQAENPSLLIGCSCNALACVGVKRVLLGRDGAGGTLFAKVELLLFRMRDAGTDFLITLTSPISADEFNRCSINSEFENIMKQLNASFQVLDFGLFG